MSVPIERIAEVAVVVSDLERSVRFYSEVLGMEVWDRQADHATVRCGKGFIGLWLPGAWKLPPSDNSAPLVLDVTHGRTAGLIRANLPDVEAVGRL